MKTLVNKSTKEVHKALIAPINELAKILRKKLKGAYGLFKIRELLYYWDSTRCRFPGDCYIESINGKRNIVIIIHNKFTKWDLKPDWKAFLSFELIEEEKYSKDTYKVKNGKKTREGFIYMKIKFERLDNPKFINDVKNWLMGNEISWEKWEEK